MRKVVIEDGVLKKLPSKEDLDRLKINQIGQIYFYESEGLYYKLHYISPQGARNEGYWGWIMMNNSFGYGGRQENCQTIEECIELAIKKGKLVYQLHQEELFKFIKLQ